MTPTLNWKELALWVDQTRPVLRGLFVDRVIVAERPHWTDGYLKNEWCVRLSDRRHEFALFASIRPRSPYVALMEGKGPRASTQATQSPFGQELAKALRGSRLIDLEALPRERIVILWFSSEEKKFGWILSLIPATPESFLIDSAMKTLARSRGTETDKTFTPPANARPPADPPMRTDILSDPFLLSASIERELELEAFETRKHATFKLLQEARKHAQVRIQQNQKVIDETIREPDWGRYGDLLKGSLPFVKTVSRALDLKDFATGESTPVPCDPKLSPQQQVEKFYQNARRRTRRLEESKLRLDAGLQLCARIDRALEILRSLEDSKDLATQWDELKTLERLSLSLGSQKNRPASKSTDKKSSSTGWSGRLFISQDGLPIWVGRSRDENLELTFKCARGNDLWMHLRGRPGAHTVIPLSSGKTAPLETLLDAAVLTIHFSKGTNWGKTEVDYTFKKHVKRIKDSTEASYTHNKTLIIEPAADRLKRLLGQS